VLGVRGLETLDVAVVNVAAQVAISIQAVGHHRAARLDRLGDEPVQRSPLYVGDVAEPDAFYEEVLGDVEGPDAGGSAGPPTPG
jgi:hypothetical protein